jgi:cell division transport system ATP-binding protein
MNAKNLLAFQKARLRQEMGIVFQDFKLLNHLTILENVALALRIRGLEGPKSGAQAHELLRWLGIEETDRLPSTLSGGEQQRVAIARAVITRPKFLIADEPTGSVDDETALKIFYLFQELYKIGTTVLVATHSHDLMTAFPYPAFRIEEGKVIVETPSRSPFTRSASFSFPEVA